MKWPAHKDHAETRGTSGWKVQHVERFCIDKSNNTEFSEAINSMFQWYKNATRCYVYLSDVLKSDTENVKDPLRASWKKKFRESRWFTRGWTLQELIAPSCVEFFAQNGQRLGDKTSLEQLIHEITGVSINALRGSSLSNFSIDERMSWSNGRKTKKAEDKAYSLWGIFNVHMPLIYGEGEEKAFNRLRIEIDQQSAISRAISEQVSLLSRIPIAMGASFDSHAEEYNPTCLPGTRMGALHEITKWAEDPNAKAMFWLNGMAGTGKSTISRTLARSFSKRAQLGASFFFKRGEGDRGGVSKFFATITAQLVQREPALTRHVKDVIDRDPTIFGKALQEQFNNLILEPLSKTHSCRENNGAVVIVIDALDECDGDEDTKKIIQLFSNANSGKPLLLRTFLTSRPDLPIRLGFASVQDTYQDLLLHEIDECLIKDDIHVYFEHELGKIKAEYNTSVPNHRRLPSSWGTHSQIQILAEMATPLFISASTACRFIAEQNRKSKLDDMYLLVLEQLLSGMSNDEEEKTFDLFRRVVGSIVLLEQPLPTVALANLLDISEDTIDTLLDSLHSVLNIPPSPQSPVRLLHLSFREFLIDPLNRNKHRFWVDKSTTHRYLLKCYLHIMNKTFNLGNLNVRSLRYPLKAYDPLERPDTPTLEVQYVWPHWVYHAQELGDRTVLDDEDYHFLEDLFGHWGWQIVKFYRALGHNIQLLTRGT
ncbi:heterokaryon incompatibility protein-domain-containing protein [Xylaria bambusicola]|uniref:heterokaryon incompatibility protein-domain-containing protein n=1 Tax=Xylaria bambusicola TaxID=326684 RepID=UPI0020087B67|nr:heterokaryon incompatibility protein-domain-containing protein [Xylaria bambusicola]KAI0512704.1 heterokaryon incompatibility protein-domain-containing protein [Xylaria bambusicola]